MINEKTLIKLSINIFHTVYSMPKHLLCATVCWVKGTAGQFDAAIIFHFIVSNFGLRGFN
jgi:hypothetical protein